ncbi:MAG: hypothetical protein GXY42_05555 [Desulfovibrionales bacterium]|nr:hypothetical protein [Desulfovibrionales bacterium]
MRIAAVQVSGIPGDVQGNLEKIRIHTQKGAAAGCRLLLFPELTDLGYDLRAVPRHGPATWKTSQGVLAGLAREFSLCLVCGVCLADGHNHANALVAWGPDGEILVIYRKTHLFRAGDIDETQVFRAGDAATCFELDGIRFGLSICYDLRFPELFRTLALGGCHVLLLAAAWPRARIHVWKPLCIARAVENQCYLVGANLVGDQGMYPCGGASLFVTPAGQTTEADPRQECLVHGSVCTEELREIRNAVPALAHRRPDLYARGLSYCPSSL